MGYRYFCPYLYIIYCACLVPIFSALSISCPCLIPILTLSCSSLDPISSLSYPYLFLSCPLSYPCFAPVLFLACCGGGNKYYCSIITDWNNYWFSADQGAVCRDKGDPPGVGPIDDGKARGHSGFHRCQCWVPRDPEAPGAWEGLGRHGSDSQGTLLDVHFHFDFHFPIFKVAQTPLDVMACPHLGETNKTIFLCLLHLINFSLITYLSFEKI